MVSGIDNKAARCEVSQPIHYAHAINSCIAPTQPQLRRMACEGQGTLTRAFLLVRACAKIPKIVIHLTMEVFWTNDEISASFKKHRALRLDWPTVDVLEVEGADISMLS